MFPDFDPVFIGIEDTKPNLSERKFDLNYSRRCREMKPKCRR